METPAQNGVWNPVTIYYLLGTVKCVKSFHCDREWIHIEGIGVTFAIS
jgi:hypothetical protein